MNAADLCLLVDHFFREEGAAFGLDPATVSVTYVLNEGGFVNASYRVVDARRACHLKLATNPDNLAALRRWHALAGHLGAYHAPPILDWIDVGPAAGLLFPVVAGATPSLHNELLAAVVPVLRQLGRDAALASALAPPVSGTAAGAYRDTLHDRFTEDLRGIRATPPPFMSGTLLQRLDEEVEALARLVAGSAAFDVRLTRPVHGDCWLNNILWTGGEDWYLLDWDDLRIGDPVADLASLLGPTADDPVPLRMVDRVEHLLDAAERERLRLLGRATLLDWVIDPVADWVEATTSPAHLAEVRRWKERVHRQALARYQERYGLR